MLDCTPRIGPCQHVLHENSQHKMEWLYQPMPSPYNPRRLVGGAGLGESRSRFTVISADRNPQVCHRAPVRVESFGCALAERRNPGGQLFGKRSPWLVGRPTFTRWGRGIEAPIAHGEPQQIRLS
jgi:hypothetical protein